MGLKPVGDRIVVKALEAETKTKGGIVVPDTAKERPQQGKVVAIGIGKLLEDGKIRPLEVKVGDRILFARYAGTEITVKDEELLILREEDVLAVVKG